MSAYHGVVCVHIHIRKHQMAESSLAGMLHHRLTVVVKLLTGGNLKLIQQILGGQFLLLFTAYIIDDLALIHHNQPVADGNGVLHIVGNHNGGQVISVRSSTFLAVLGSNAAVCSSSSSTLGFFKVAINRVTAWR